MRWLIKNPTGLHTYVYQLELTYESTIGTVRSTERKRHPPPRLHTCTFISKSYTWPWSVELTMEYMGCIYISITPFESHILCCLILWILYNRIHYVDVIMTLMASQITSLSIVYSQMASNAENVSIWWRHHAIKHVIYCTCFHSNQIIIVLADSCHANTTRRSGSTYCYEHPSCSLGPLLLTCPDSKVHGANMGPIWGRQDPGGPHDGPMNLAMV